MNNIQNENRTLPTETQVKVLMSDWLGNLREEGKYTYKNTTGAISRKMKKGESLSDFITGGIKTLDVVELMKTARETAQTVVNSMTETPVKVTVGGDGSSYDGNEIKVATMHFDDKRLSPGEKMDILTGFAVHEACHVNHSDFDALTRQIEHKDGTGEIRKYIMNVLEDERIELLLGDTPEAGGDGMPGMTDYISCAKKYIFDTYRKSNVQKKPTETVAKFLDTILTAVRFPTMMNEETVRERYEELNAVRGILTPFPRETSEIEKATDSIIDVMKDMIRKEMENSQKENNNQNSGEHNINPTSEQIDQKTNQACQTEEVKQMLNQIQKCINANKDNGSGTNASTSLQGSRTGQLNAEYVNGDSEKAGDGAGQGDIQFIRKPKGCKNEYDQSLKRIKRYIPAMAKALRCKTRDRDYELMGMKSGKLNTNKLVTLRTGNPNIFTKKGSFTCDSACISILIDESGSMKGNQRLKGVRDAAVLICESVKHIPNLELFVYGFGENELNIYYERGRECRWALGSTKANGGTPTSDAMKIAAKRIRKLTNNTCLMTILTDGRPDNTLQTKEIDEKLAKQGFINIGIDIAGSDQVKQVFREAIVTSDVQELAPYLSKIIKKRLINNLKTYETT